MPYIQGEQLKELIQTKSRLKKESLIDLFVTLSSDLIKAVGQGKLSEDAASIRALLDACDLSTIIPPRRAIQRAIIGKLDEEREQSLVENLSATLF